MKVVGITILRNGGAGDPIPVTMACDLSSYGFFQRQVREHELCGEGTEKERERDGVVVSMLCQ